MAAVLPVQNTTALAEIKFNREKLIFAMSNYDSITQEILDNYLKPYHEKRGFYCCYATSI